jgi:hypothetical protein
MQTLAQFEDAFAAALLAPEPVPDTEAHPWAKQRGFAVYRNTVLKACVDALLANFPAALRLVGEDWMRATATEFARTHLPREPMLAAYGAEFPEFLAGFAPAADMPWLAQVAALDRCWSESHIAADARVLSPTALTSLAPDQLAAIVLRPHPAARWRWFADRPIYSFWSRNRQPGEVSLADIPWQAEGALLTRPTGAVQWRPLSSGGAAFLDQCAHGATVAEAAGAALAAQPGIDLAALMALLLDAGAFAAMP